MGLLTRSTALVVAGLLGTALASCPNSCSGHGTCGAGDVCTCAPNFSGADCSLRVCAFGKSWAVDAANPHDYQECSGQGICDRVTGECACFAGFTGRACGRSECPNSCSGNGVCKLIGDLNDVLTIPYSGANWDVDRIQTCVCDNGFTGPDCSQRFCPTGDDPLTVCQSTNTISYQELRFTLGSAVKWDVTKAAQASVAGAGVTYTATDETMDYFGTKSGTDEVAARAAAPGAMRITYRDQFNGSYVAHAAGSVFVATAANAYANDALEIALETLPQQKVKNVAVTSALASTASNGGVDYVPQRRYVVAFHPDATNSANVGTQAPLSCDTGYSCTEAGCQPIVSMPFLYRYAGMDTDAALGTTFTTVGGASSADNINFYTGNANTDAAWAAGKFVRLHASSQPQMPFNVPVDTAAAAGNTGRYDMRILVAVVDPANNLDDAADLVYVRVIAGHNNITSNIEAIGYPGWPASPTYKGVWGFQTPSTLGGVTPAAGAAKPWTTGLTGFTALGPIVADASAGGAFKMTVPGAPGVALHFGAANIVHNDGKGRWYEILVKLPSCSTAALVTGSEFTDITGAALAAVDAQVENVECSNRGSCDRATGRCACYNGFTGAACNKQTVLV